MDSFFEVFVVWPLNGITKLFPLRRNRKGAQRKDASASLRLDELVNEYTAQHEPRFMPLLHTDDEKCKSKI